MNIQKKPLTHEAVRFTPVGARAGLQASPIAPRPGFVSSEADLGPGACFLDYDGDGRSDLLLATGNPAGALRLYHNLGNGRFQDVTRAAGLRVHGLALGCTAGDYDNDGKTDLAISFSDHVALFRNLGNGRFVEVTKAAGLTTHGLPLGLTFVDYDHDGDLDLALADNGTSGVHFLFRNRLPASARQRGLNVLVLDGRGRYTRAGAEVRAYKAGTRTLLGTTMVDTGSGYCSQNLAPVHLGFAAAGPVDIEVTSLTASGRLVTRVPGVDPKALGGTPLVVRAGPPVGATAQR